MIWIEPQQIEISAELQNAVGGHPIVSQTLARRGLNDPQHALAFLDPQHYTPTPPTDLPGLIKAADLIENAIRHNKNIFVWGDFDVDGQTSTTLLVSALQDLGAQVDFHIPLRATESHGVGVAVLKDYLPKIDLLLTCDVGISADTAVAYARQRGVDVVITDHHDLPENLPDANAIVNSKMLPEEHPAAMLSGVGVAFKLVEELFQRANRTPETEKYLDLVALGLVADVVPQTGDVRYLIQRGLQVLRETQRLGLQQLYEKADLNPTLIDEEHIGFSIGPRLNALGRLSDANLIVEFFTTEDPSRARILADQLDGLNEQRKLLTEQVYQGALDLIERDPSLLDHAALVLAHPLWHGGIIGIVASRLVEAFNKPTILLSAPPDRPAHGSARSIEGCDISSAIAAQADMLIGFGGHPMAAGLSLESALIPTFRQALSKTVQQMLGTTTTEAALTIDGSLLLSDLTLDLIEDIERLSPFGAGNPALTFVSHDLILASQRTVGRSGDHLRLVVTDSQGNSQTVMWWRGDESKLPGGTFDLAYQLRASSFKGNRQISLVWVDSRITEEMPLEAAPKTTLEIIDHRTQPDQITLLRQLLNTDTNLQIWCEDSTRKEIGGKTRRELSPLETLVIWNPPPDRQTLQVALESTSPGKVILFAIDPGNSEPQAFLMRLAGLVKTVINRKQGKTNLEDLAAACAQRHTTVRLGLRWLSARGNIIFRIEDDDSLLIQPGTQKQDPYTAEQLFEHILILLEETRAYRTFYTQASVEQVIYGNS